MEAPSGTRPTRTKRIDMRAFAAARRTAQGSVTLSPMPTANPLRATTMGLVRRTASTHRVGVASSSPPSRSSVKSAPAQKARPVPVSTMAPMAGSPAQASRQAIASSVMAVFQALSFSGRLRVRMPTRPSMSVRMAS